MKLNKKIEQQRKKLRLSRREISEELNIKETMYCNWEQSKSKPSHDQLIMLADYFKITTDELLGRKVWRKLTDTPEAWGYYLLRKKGSRQVTQVVFDETKFLTDTTKFDEWCNIP